MKQITEYQVEDTSSARLSASAQGRSPLPGGRLWAVRPLGALLR